MDRETVYKIVDTERDYQDAKWGAEKHSLEEFLVYQESYINEAKHLLARESGLITKDRVMANMRKITALGVAAMEQHDTPPRKEV